MLAQEARVFSCVATQPLGLHLPSETISAIITTKPKSESALPPELQRSLDSDQWMFTHDQLQQAANILLSVSQRALVHSEIGAALIAIPKRDEVALQCLVYNLNESRRLGFRNARETDLALSECIPYVEYWLTDFYFSQVEYTSR